MANDESPPDRYALIGHPVEHSRSPLIHQLFARQTGQRLTYELIDAKPPGFKTAVRTFWAAGGKGLNVTVPHKEAAFRLADEVSAAASKARAVNTLTYNGDLSHGDNTDGIGFLRDVMVNLRQPIKERRVLILGAGGAARGIVGPLLEAGPGELVLANRTLERAEQLVKELRVHGAVTALTFAGLAKLEPFDILINATSAGVKGEAAPFPDTLIGPASFCYDLAYSSSDTPFVAWARSHEAGRAVQGWGMLVEQAAESFYIWRGVRPDTAPILKQLVR
ncbi:MAG TPA: shikimate dehydrogenase [Gammaproteobacteria bacterium]|nr:shikimate dehydrogenase [Gammaproteobacteria bacterium]